MNKEKPTLEYVVMFTVLLLIAHFSFMFVHEEVHKQVCRLVGGKAKKEFGLFEARTQCFLGENDRNYEERVEKIKKLNAETEIIGYHIYWAVIISFFMWFLGRKLK